MFLKTELSMFEATALGRSDEVAEMQSRLSQTQKEMARASLNMTASFQQAVEQHRLQLTQSYCREIESLKSQIATFAFSADDRSRSLTQQLASAGSDM